MMKNKDKKKAEFAKKILNKILVLEANSNSCIVAYQPKTPSRLEKFKNAK